MLICYNENICEFLFDHESGLTTADSTVINGLGFTIFLDQPNYLAPINVSRELAHSSS